jgi:hypothetical protein
MRSALMQASQRSLTCVRKCGISQISQVATLRTFITEELSETDVEIIQLSAGLLVLQDMFNDLRSDTVCTSTKMLQLRLMLRRTAESH